MCLTCYVVWLNNGPKCQKRQVPVSMCIINHRRPCAARVNVLGLSVSVCPVYPLPLFLPLRATREQNSTMSMKGFIAATKGDFRRTAAFKRYGLKTKRTS